MEYCKPLAGSASARNAHTRKEGVAEPFLAFSQAFDRAVQLPQEAKDAMRADFLAAIEALTRRGLSLERALERMSPDRFCGFLRQGADCVVSAGRWGEAVPPDHGKGPNAHVPH